MTSIVARRLILALTLVLLAPVPKSAPLATAPDDVRPASTPSTGVLAPQPARITDLPVSAQAAISTTLGQEDPAYHAVPVSAGWLMRNPHQGITATFGSERIVVGTGVGTETVEWGVHLRAYGRGDIVTPVPAVMPERAANRLD